MVDLIALDNRRKYWYYYFNGNQFSLEMLNKLIEVVEEQAFWEHMARVRDLPIDMIIKSGEKFHWGYYFDCSYNVNMNNVKLICEKILQNKIANVEDCLYAMPSTYMPQEIILLNKKQNFSWEYYFENFDDLRKSLLKRIYNNNAEFGWHSDLSLQERKELLKFMSTNIKKLINEDIKDKDFWNFLPDNFWTTEMFVNKQNVVDWGKFVNKYCFIQDEKIRMLLPLISNKKFWECISNGFRFTLEEIIVYQNHINWNKYFDNVKDKKMMNKLRKLLINNSNFINTYNEKYSNWYKFMKKRIKRDKHMNLLYKKEDIKQKKEMEKLINHNYNEDFFINYHIS